MAIVLSAIVSFVRSETRLTIRSTLAALEKGGRDMMLIAAATAACGLIIGAVTMTGLALRFTSLILSFGQATLLLPLMMTMLACLLLGVGMPTAAAYLIVAALAIPALNELGVPMLQAHLFAYYFAVLANVTPPVSLAAYAGASIAKAPMVRTGLAASKISLAGFIIPYMFVFGPSLLLQGTVPHIVWSAITAALGVTALAAGLEGWLLCRAQLYERVLLLGAALTLIKPGVLTDVVGLAIILPIFFVQIRRSRLSETLAVESTSLFQ
jgi:TRAP-type uncharacterized transport system fused permease subunit